MSVQTNVPSAEYLAFLEEGNGKNQQDKTVNSNPPKDKDKEKDPDKGNSPKKVNPPPSSKEGKNKKRKAFSLIEEYAKQLELDNRTPESFMLLKTLDCMPSKSLSYCFIMSIGFFQLYYRLNNSDKISDWRAKLDLKGNTQLDVPHYINYGVVSKNNSMLKIYNEDPPKHLRGVVFQITDGVNFPSMRIPNCKELLIIYRGGPIVGCLPPKLEFLGLERFKDSININWKLLLTGLNNLL
uniref:Uncharacterized protein n=1 Tax=Strongyloides papillosus TaxID=174720 RepID=A0A0N5C6F4_STREA